MIACHKKEIPHDLSQARILNICTSSGGIPVKKETRHTGSAGVNAGPSAARTENTSGTGMQKAADASGKNARPRSPPRGIQPKSQKPNRRRKNSAAARSGQAPGSATTHSARRATTTAAPGAAPNAASARNENSPASRGGRSSQFRGRYMHMQGMRIHELTVETVAGISGHALSGQMAM